MRKYYVLCLFTVLFAALLIVGHIIEKKVSATVQPLDSLLENSSFTAHDLKADNNAPYKHVYTPTNIDSLFLPDLTAKFLSALQQQNPLLDREDISDSFGNLDVTADQLKEVVQSVREAKSKQDLTGALDAFQICGDDRLGNVQFTGYYAPLVEVRRSPDADHKFPLYIKSATKNDGALRIVYVKDREDVLHMRIEGVSTIEFPNGARELLSFDGEYERVTDLPEEIKIPATTDEIAPDKTPKKVLASYSSVFTPKVQKNPFGASRVPLTSDFSVAVDKRFIPLGSVLLALVPIADDKGNLLRSEYRFVLAQDVGSAIKGAGHVDLYMGEGEKGKRRAQSFHKYGKIWLLLPKKNKTLASNL